MSTLALQFQNTQFDIVDRNNQPWLRLPQIEGALGYTNKGKGLSNIYQRNKDEFTENMTALIELDTEGGKQQVRIFSLRGCHLLAMLSRTKIAKEFRKWVLDVLEQQTGAAPLSKPERKTKIAFSGCLTLAMQDNIKALVKSRAAQLPADKQTDAVVKQWSAIKTKFGCTYKNIPAEEYLNVISLLERLPLTGELQKQQPAQIITAQPLEYGYTRARDSINLLRKAIALNPDDTLNTELLNELDVLERCLVHAWTHVDESLIRLSTAQQLLNRWRNS